MSSRLTVLPMLLLLLGCGHKSPQFHTEVLLPYTPVKNQGRSQVCWAYAMLSAIETEHIGRGDSVHLSVAFVERVMEQAPDVPTSKRGMGITAINLIQRYGLVPYQAMPTTDTPLPRMAFMLGCDYTLQEFARSVCAPGEYIGLMADVNQPFGQMVEPQLPDNWEHNRLLNLPMDSLLQLTQQAIRQRHGVCWEGDISETGFDWEDGIATTSLWNGSTTDDHCMAIVGLATDADGESYFIMKNSWGTDNIYGGLLYMSYHYFLQKTIAVYLPAELLRIEN